MNESLLWKVCHAQNALTNNEKLEVIKESGIPMRCGCQSEFLDACAIILKRIDDELRTKWHMSRRATFYVEHDGEVNSRWFGDATDADIDAWLAMGNNPGANFRLKNGRKG